MMLNFEIRENEKEMGNTMREQMNEDQKKIVDYVFEKIEQLRNGTLENGCVYIDGPGGSEKHTRIRHCAIC